jgi:hypothetical protein
VRLEARNSKAGRRAVAVSSVAENVARVIVPAFPVPPWAVLPSAQVKALRETECKRCV